MHIHNLYVYPVKSLRPIALNSTQISSLGPLHDRIFMLQHESPPATPEGGPSYRNMHITHYPQLSLLQPAFHPSLPSFLIRYNPAVPEESSVEFEIPLTPETDGLARREINMHNSSCTGYDMGDSYAAFFTTCLGFPTRLIYLGPSRRPVLGSVVPQTNTGLLSFIPSFIPINRSPKAGISFADCAPLLITTRSSLNAVSEMLPGGEEMDITKFRPNVVLDADSEDELKPWEEDFWGEIQIAGHRVVITANCARCKSINIDYTTGTSVPPDRQPLKMLMKDRRVDPGMKYSPIFGRYGFLADEDEDGVVVNVGDKVTVSKRNQERTEFYWPGLSTGTRT